MRISKKHLGLYPNLDRIRIRFMEAPTQHSQQLSRHGIQQLDSGSTWATEIPWSQEAPQGQDVTQQQLQPCEKHPKSELEKSAILVYSRGCSIIILLNFHNLLL